MIRFNTTSRKLVPTSAILLILITTLSVILQVNHVKAVDSFLQISATDSTKFSYKGTDVVLQGVNANNLNALGIWQAANINNIEVGPGDYEKIYSLGANHVRFGISYQWYLNNPTNFYNVIDNQIAWARENNLWLIPTVFTLPYLGENTNDGMAYPSGGCYQGYANPCNFWGSTQAARDARTAFKNFWVEFIDHYKNNNVIAGYDFINEPWSVDESYQREIFSLDYFTEIITDVINGNHNSTQLFFIESEPEPLSWVVYHGYTQGVSKINNLKTITSNRIALSNHMYAPINFTHYTGVVYPYTEGGVTWNNSTMTNPTAPQAHPGSVVQALSTGGSVTVNGVTYTTFASYVAAYPTDLKNRFGILFAQQDIDVPIYMGEWSAKQAAAADETGWYTNTFLDYNSDVANLFSTWGVSNAVFEFKAGHESWGLYTETNPQPLGSFDEQVSYNRDNSAQTVQPFIDTLETIWGSNVVPDFVVKVASLCQNGIIEGTEQCDDGNNVALDGCSILCGIERKGPVISSNRNICQVSATLSDFRFDGHHRISTATYNPASIPADTGYTISNQALKLGNDGTNYFVPYVWFESVNLAKNATVSNAYVDFNISGNTSGTSETATIYGLKVGGNLRTYDRDGAGTSSYYVDRAPYSTYLGGANWISWKAYSTDSATSPFVGFPHDTLTRSNGAVYQWPRTTASSSWSLPVETLVAGDYYVSPNISTVVNELLAESAWQSGNDFGLILIPGTGDSSSYRLFYGYDASITTALNTYSYTPTNADSARFPKFYANCSNYVSGLNAINNFYSARSNHTINGDVKTDSIYGTLANPGSYTLTYSVVRNVAHGVLSLNQADGTFTYTPTTDYSGTDSFMYVVSDLNGGTSNASVTLQIIGNTFPFVNPQVTVTGSLTSPYTFASNATDSDGSISSYLWSLVSGPGTVTFGSSTTSSTTALFSGAGTYVVQIVVTDNENGSTTQTLTIQVPAPATNPYTPYSLNSQYSGGIGSLMSYPVSYPSSYPTGYVKYPDSQIPSTSSNAQTDSNSSNLAANSVIIVICCAGSLGILAFIVLKSRKSDNR